MHTNRRHIHISNTYAHTQKVERALDARDGPPKEAVHLKLATIKGFDDKSLGNSLFLLLLLWAKVN